MVDLRLEKLHDAVYDEIDAIENVLVLETHHADTMLVKKRLAFGVIRTPPGIVMHRPIQFNCQPLCRTNEILPLRVNRRG